MDKRALPNLSAKTSAALLKDSQDHTFDHNQRALAEATRLKPLS
jgi:hypothetical protein